MTAPSVVRPDERKLWLLLTALAAVLSAVSLLWVGEATSRDTNNWLIWARQLSLGHSLDFTGGVPSWKPLPVLFAAPFARVSPDLSNIVWLWLVRFCWLGCSILLAALIRNSYGRFGAAVAAALPLALPAWFAFALMGDSEPVAVALGLGAVILAMESRIRAATALLIAAGLLRPELWLFIVALNLWQWRRDKRIAITNLLVAAAILFIGWSLVPAIAGGGWAQAASRASTRLLVGNQADGFLSLLPTRAWLLVLIGVVGVWLRRDRQLALFGLACIALPIEVEVMSWFGFSGLDRYVMPGAIGLCAFAGVGAATLVGLTQASWARGLIGIAVLALVGSLIWASVPLDRANVKERRAEGASARRAVSAFERAGGVDRFTNCMPLATNGSWTVILGRMMGLPLHDLTNFKTAPAVVLRPTRLKNYKNGPAIEARGIKPVVVGYAAPDWAVLLYPGCESNSKR